MNKKADTNMAFIVVGLVITTLICIIIFMVISDKLNKSVNIAGLTVDSTKVDTCKANWQRNNPDKDIRDFDDDKDGIVDSCDVCVIRTTRENYDVWVKSQNLEKQAEWLSDRGITGRPTYDEFIGLFKNVEMNDRDGDGIYDGCDSNSKKLAVVWFGGSERRTQKECEAVGKIWSGLMTFTSRQSTLGGYMQCVATLN
jgi:hypothetical protein